MAEYIDEGRAPVVLDVSYHTTYPVPVSIAGGITVSGVTLQPGDIEIGAVELKDASTDQRAVITVAGDLQVTLAGESVAVTGPLTDVELRASAVSVTVSGVLFDGSSNLKVTLATVLDYEQDTVEPRINANLLNIVVEANQAFQGLIGQAGTGTIRVMSLLLIASGLCSIRFSSDGQGVTGWVNLDALGAGFSLPFPPTRDFYHFSSQFSEGLDLEIDPPTYVAGWLNYIVTS